MEVVWKHLQTKDVFCTIKSFAIHIKEGIHIKYPNTANKNKSSTKTVTFLLLVWLLFSPEFFQSSEYSFSSTCAVISLTIYSLQ